MVKKLSGMSLLSICFIILACIANCGVCDTATGCTACATNYFLNTARDTCLCKYPTQGWGGGSGIPVYVSIQPRGGGGGQGYLSM